jgi:hypothetical protein
MSSRQRRIRWARSVRCVRRAYSAAGLHVPRVEQLAGLGFWELVAMLHGAESGGGGGAVVVKADDDGLFSEVTDGERGVDGTPTPRSRHGGA